MSENEKVPMVITGVAGELFGLFVGLLVVGDVDGALVTAAVGELVGSAIGLFCKTWQNKKEACHEKNMKAWQII